MFGFPSSRALVKQGRRVLTTRGLTLGGGAGAVITPPTIAADQNDYSPPGFATASVWRLSSDGGRAIGGMAGGWDGRVVTIQMINNSLSLSTENLSSAAQNRFALTFAGGLTLQAGSSITFIYDGTSQRWRPLSYTGPLANTSTFGVARFATAAEYRQATSDANVTVLTPANAWAAADLVTLTDASPIAVDMSTGFNFIVTFTSGVGATRQLANPSNTKNGQSGVFYCIQDGSGNRALTYAGNYKFSGATAFTLSTAANAVDIISYTVRSSTFISMTGIVKDVR